MEQSGKRRCYARIEFRAVQQEVEARLGQGYSLAIIYEELRKAGRLTMAYATFCDYARGGGRRVHGKPKPTSKPHPFDLAIGIMEPVELRVDCGYNLMQIYQGLVNSGVGIFDYAAFYDFIHDGEKLRIGQVMDEDFVYVENDGFLPLLEKLASFFEAESDSSSSDFYGGLDSVSGGVCGLSDSTYDEFLGMED